MFGSLGEKQKKKILIKGNRKGDKEKIFLSFESLRRKRILFSLLFVYEFKKKEIKHHLLKN